MAVISSKIERETIYEGNIPKKQKTFFVVLLLLISLIILFGIKSIISSLTINAEFQIQKMEREKQALTEQINYLDCIIKDHSLSYRLIFDGTEDELRRSVPSVKAARLDDRIETYEVAEIIGTLDNHINEPVDFTIKGDNYLLVVYKYLIRGEVRYYVK